MKLVVGAVHTHRFFGRVRIIRQEGNLFVFKAFRDGHEFKMDAYEAEIQLT